MSNMPSDHPSIRVHAPPGGRSNNIFGSNADEQHTKPTTIAGQYKQTQMKSNIFGTDDPTPARHASNKNKSNIFGTDNDDDQNKKHSGVRQGLRVGYNPINGESYSTKDNVNSKVDTNEKPADAPTNAAQQENATVQETATTSTENDKTKTSADNTKDTNNAQKGVHTSVRVFHPPGGKSSGPLW